MIDNLNILEIINLVTVGLSSYNFRNHVASDVGLDQKYLDSANIMSQNYMDNISLWTKNHKMQLNEEKSKIMIFNFTKKFKFATRIKMNNILLDTVSETKILGLIISSNLSWKSNTNNLVKKANKRMIIIIKLKDFPIPMKDLTMIYCQFIRCMLEFNSNVWFSSITEEESEDLERVQRNACKIMLGIHYTGYEEALERLNLDTLKDRREKLALKFGQKCLKIEQMENCFKKNMKNVHDLRKQEEYEVKFASSTRLFNSTIPTLQRMLNN